MRFMLLACVGPDPTSAKGLFIRTWRLRLRVMGVIEVAQPYEWSGAIPENKAAGEAESWFGCSVSELWVVPPDPHTTTALRKRGRVTHHQCGAAPSDSNCG